MTKTPYLLVLAAIAYSSSSAAEDNTEGTTPSSSQEIIIAEDDSNAIKSKKNSQNLHKYGYSLGDFKVQPQLNVFYRHDDNIFSLHDNEISDNIHGIAGSLNVLSNWEQNKLDFRTGFESGRHNTYDTEDYDDAWTSIDGHFATTQNNKLLAGASYSYSHEERGSPDDFFGDEPTIYSSTKTYFGDSYDGDIFSFRTALSTEWLDYDDASVSDGLAFINNDDRDRIEYEWGTRFGFKKNEATKHYIQLVVDQRDYDKGADDYGIIRNSDGYRAGLGTVWEVTQHIKTDIYIGKIYQAYDDARFNHLSKPQINANVKWQPWPYTELSIYTKRSLEESTLPASGYLLTTGGVSLKHQLTPRGILNAHFMVGDEEFQNYERKDEILDAGISYRYFLSKNIYLDSGYRFTGRDSSLDRLGDNLGQSANEANIQNFEDFHNSVVYLSLGTLLYPAPENPWPKIRVIQPAYADVDWAGLYFGSSLGHGGLVADVDSTRTDGTDSGPYGNLGDSYGFFLGYGWQPYGSWYIGLEGEQQNSDLEFHHYKDKPNAQTLSLAKDNTYRGSVRVGYEVPNGTLLYAKLGRTRIDHHTYNTINNATDVAYSDTEHSWASNTAIGSDIPAGDHLFIRMEYSLTFVDDYDIAVIDATDTIIPTNYDITEPVFNLGLGWQLGQQITKTRPVIVDHNGFYAGFQLAHGTFGSQAYGVHSDSGGGGGSSDFYGDFADISDGNYAVNMGYGFTVYDWYFALEASAGTSDGEWRHDREPDGRIFGVEKKGEYSWGARFGYILDSGTLVYLHTAAVKAHFNTDWLKGSSTFNLVERDDHIWGNRVGLGTEIPLTNRLSIRLDYSYTDYNSYSFTTSHGTPDSMTFENEESLFSTGFSISL